MVPIKGLQRLEALTLVDDMNDPKILQEVRRDNDIHFPDGVIVGVGETIFEPSWSGPWTLGSKNDGRDGKRRDLNTLPSMSTHGTPDLLND